LLGSVSDPAIPTSASAQSKGATTAFHCLHTREADNRARRFTRTKIAVKSSFGRRSNGIEWTEAIETGLKSKRGSVYAGNAGLQCAKTVKPVFSFVRGVVSDVKQRKTA
jgi:hypothetical protein